MADARATKAGKDKTEESAARETQTRGFLDRYFHISERQSTVGTEIRGGVVTACKQASTLH